MTHEEHAWLMGLAASWERSACNSGMFESAGSAREQCALELREFLREYSETEPAPALASTAPPDGSDT